MPEEVIQSEPISDSPEVVDNGVVSEVKLNSFDAFESARNEGGKSVQPKPSRPVVSETSNELEQESEEVENATEGIKGVNTPKQEVAQEDIEGQPDLKIKPSKKIISRDYSIFDSADVDAFKKMGNEAFDKVKKIYQENKELKSRPTENKSGLPDSYYSHPEAYTLVPEYKKTSDFLKQAEGIQSHWKKQEYNINKNGKISTLDWDPVNKKIVVSAERDATEADVELVEKMLSDSRDQTSEQKTKLKEITTGFKIRHDADVSFIKDAEKRFFPDFDDGEKDPTKELRAEIVKTLPESLKSNPLTSIFSKVGAHNAMLLNQVKTLQKEIATLKGVKQDEKASPPGKKNFVSGGKNTGIVDFDFMDKARREGRV